MGRTWTEEEKEEQRQRMLALHAEGRAGGEFGKLGGRPRNKRASEHLAEIASLLRKGVGHDFTNYKEKTVIRRIQRRMNVFQFDSVGSYIGEL